MIPPHDDAGPVHAGFTVDGAELSAWEQRLDVCGVEIVSCVDWPKGGRSIYFRDPDSYLLELLTPGVWAAD